MSDTPDPYLNVDPTTRERIGSLAARDFTEMQIADVLLLSFEQVIAAKASPEYKRKYAEVANDMIQRQLDLADGWDLIEEQAVANVLETLKYNRDPQYTLMAAKMANTAIRRKGAKSEQRVVDSSKVQNNVIVLNLNKTYIQGTQSDPNRGMINITPKVKEISQRQTDLPSPAQVEKVLAPVKNSSKDIILTELEQMIEASGVFKDTDVL